MNAICQRPNRRHESHLERVVEPLASYISAASSPQAALRTALAVLVSVVEETNRAASTHLTRNWERN